MNNPILSVIIPCYNNGKLLAEMLDCCIRQSFQEWEVIVVDDGSTDDTPSIVEEYAAKDQRIQFYHRDREPKGSLTSRNIGFSHSKGKYIIHFDADDLISDTCFEKRVAFMDVHPECDYATFKGRGFSMKDGQMVFHKGTPYGVNKVDGDLLMGFLTTHYPFSIWNNIYRREAIADYEWDERVKVYSDFSYAVPVILKGMNHQFADIAEEDYYYRQFYSKNNMCASAVNEDKCASTVYLVSKTLKSLKERDDYEKRKNEFLEFIVLHYKRLILGGNYSDARKYINMLSEFYPEGIVESFDTILDRFSKAKHNKSYELRVYWAFYDHFHYSFDKTMAIHTLGKIVLGRI